MRNQFFQVQGVREVSGHGIQARSSAEQSPVKYKKE